MNKDFKIGDWVYAGDYLYGQIADFDDEEVHVEYDSGCLPFDWDEVRHAPAPVNFNKALAEALNRAGMHKGITYEEDFGLVTSSKYVDDYLVVLYLAQLLESGQAEIMIAPSKCEYMFKLLRIEE